MRFVAYQVGFYAVWGACIYGAMQGHPWLGPLAAAGFILLHLWQTEARARQVALVVFAGVFGVLSDLILIHGGGIVYIGMPEDALFGPIWIVALWMAFAPSVNVTFAWLRDRDGLGALIGSVGGVLAYEGGRRLGAASYEVADPRSTLALVVVWGLAIPLFVHAARWSEAAQADPPAPE